MKKLVAVATFLSVISLFAEDGGYNTYGLLKVNSSDSRTIVAIPWIDASTTNGEIKVFDVVRTAELGPDDSIHYYNGTGYESWRLNNETQWVAAVQSDTSGQQNGTPAAERALQRGNALILMRTNSAHRAAAFYLWGQVASSTPTNVIARSNDAKVSSLIGPPMANDKVNINDTTVITWDGVQNGDLVYFETSSNRIECQRINGKWKNFCVTNTITVGKTNPKTFKTYGFKDAESIVAGTGFWYVSTNGAQTTTKVIWEGAPKVVPSGN